MGILTASAGLAVGAGAADDDVGLLEPARARILAAACSATATIYEVGLVVM
jgi:hypothetical protein